MISRFRSVVGLGCVLGVVACALVPRTARAVDLKHKVELALDGSVINYTTIKTQVVVDDDFGPPEKQDVNNSVTTFGVLGAGMGFGVGYMASENVLLGVRTQLVSTSVDGDSTRGVKGTDILLLPRVEYLFDGETARPFLAGMVGVASTSGTGGASLTTFQLGGSLGIHAFPTDSVSFDPAISVLHYAGTSSSDIEVSGFRVLVTFGLSAWLGGQPSAPRAKLELPPVLPEGTVEEPGEAPSLDTVEVKLPHYRRLVLKHGKRPDLPTVSASVSEPGNDSDLIGCTQIGVTSNGQTNLLKEKSRVEAGDRHSVTGRIPVPALQALAAGGTFLDVCAHRWPLSLKARASIQSYLDDRARRLPPGFVEPPAPVAPPAPAVPPSEPSATPPASPPSDAPAVPAPPPAAPAAPPTSSTVPPPAPSGAAAKRQLGF